MIRIVEQQDWIVYCIVGAIVGYLLMFRTLHRDVTMVEFLQQPYENTNNNVLSWFFTTFLYCFSYAILFSYYIPVVPKLVVEDLSILGVHLNKFGFLLISLLLFYALKNILIYFFYGSIQSLKKFGHYSFVAQKYFLVYSFVILIFCVLQYYTSVNKESIFLFYLYLQLFAFILKIGIYLFHNQRILPDEWYYKILYICTLQILPNLLVWKFLFL